MPLGGSDRSSFAPTRLGHRRLRPTWPLWCQVGAALLRGDFSGALRLILGDAGGRRSAASLNWDPAALEAQQKVLAAPRSGLAQAAQVLDR